MAAKILTPAELPFVFSDVTPVPQEDGSHPVCQIDYKQDFVTSYDYMRAILNSDEKSERALELTALCLKQNPANYTIWHFRRACLTELGLTESTLEADLDLAAALGGSNPKNYQIWYHRRALLETFGLNDDNNLAQSELEYLATVFEEDAKNYHAWSHRQWLLKTVNSDELWKKEMDYVHQLITKDCRNNSAWNQQWFACHQGQATTPLSEEAAMVQAAYALEQARLDPYNESPWRFLIGVLKEAAPAALVAECQTQAVDMRQVLLEAERDPDACVNLNSARIDMLEMMASKESIEEAIELATSMADKHDVIRAKYWKLFRIQELTTKLEAL